MTSDEAREAIEVLEVAKAEVEWNYPLDYATNIDLAIEALKKQIPKKPIYGSDEQDYVKCGLCEYELGHMDDYFCLDNYCPNCGQKIDWE